MNLVIRTLAAAVLGAFAAISYAADSSADRAADAAKGKVLVDAHCGQCHSGEWEGETYDSIVKLLHGMYVGKVKHRFKIKRLNDEEINQVAAYWAAKPKGKKAAQPEEE